MTAPDVEDILQLTPLQHGMLFHSLAEPEDRLYYEQVCVFLPMVIDPETFRQALQQVVARHQALRVGMRWARLEQPVQVVFRSATLSLHLEDWSGQETAAQMQRLQTYLQADRAQGLDLQRAPLLHAALFRLGSAAHELVLSFHHAILDGWSLNLVFSEFLALYRAALAHTPARLPPAVPYRRYIAWLQAQAPQAAETHWRALLAGHAGMPAQSHAGRAPRRYGSVERRLGTALSSLLETLARQARATVNAVLQAAWGALLNRYGRGDDVVFGAVVSGRPAELEEVERIVGLFINTVPVRARLTPATSALELVRALHAQGLAGRTHGHCALTEIGRWAGLPPGRELFDTLLIFENLPGSPQGSPTVRATAIERTNYPLTLIVAPGREFALKTLFVEPVWNAGTATRLLEQLEQLLLAMSAQPEWPLARLDVLPLAQRAHLLAPPPAPPVPPAPRLDALFARLAAASPQRLALIDGERRWTFGELATAAAKVTAALGAGDGVVALLMPPSAELVASMLGVLASGHAFLLLDPTYPAVRLRFMLEDAGAIALIADPDATATVDPSGELRVMHAPWRSEDTPFSPAPQADGLAYLVYTSGSTGQPKGVMQTHSATLTRLGWSWREMPFADGDLACHRTALGFVDVVSEILTPLLVGTPLLIVTEAARRDPLALARLLAHEGVTRLLLVPSLLRALLELPDAELAGLACVREWICSGEALPTPLASRWRVSFPEARLFNLYGTSEIAGDVSAAEADPDDDGATVPMGRPMDGCELLLLDDWLAPVPAGAVGELYVGGPHLAAGYHGQPALTAARFVPHPHARGPGQRLYRTGDLARWREDAALMYVGRADQQFKLRGMRIEPGEVEAALRALPSVRQAVALPHAERLVAALTTVGNEPPDLVALQAALAARLPPHLRPEQLHVLRAMPLQPNGKVDRHAVRALLAAAPAPPAVAAVLPATPSERMLAQLWQSLLHVSEVSVADDFLSLGGHSIAAMQLVARVLKHTGHELPLAHVLERRSLRALAAELDAAGPGADDGPKLVRIGRAGRAVQAPAEGGGA